MKSIYLFSFLLALVSANFGVDSLYQYPPLGLYPCLANKKTNLTVHEIFDYQGNVTSKTFLLNYIASKDAKIKYVDARVSLNDSFSAEDICNGVAGGLPAKFNGTVWLDVRRNTNLWSQPVRFRIGYLEQLVRVCQSHGLKVGVSSSAEEWVDVMGSQGAGSDTLKAVPVWYEHENENADFDDFDYAGFGTWDTPTMKTYHSNTYLCDNIFIWKLNYFEA